MPTAPLWGALGAFPGSRGAMARERAVEDCPTVRLSTGAETRGSTGARVRSGPATGGAGVLPGPRGRRAGGPASGCPLREEPVRPWRAVGWPRASRRPVRWGAGGACCPGPDWAGSGMESGQAGSRCVESRAWRCAPGVSTIRWRGAPARAGPKKRKKPPQRRSGFIQPGVYRLRSANLSFRRRLPAREPSPGTENFCAPRFGGAASPADPVSEASGTIR